MVLDWSALLFRQLWAKVKWVWFAGLAVGLGIFGGCRLDCQYATGDSSVDIGSTFGNNINKFPYYYVLLKI